MQYSLLILSSPQTSESSASALRFAHAALNAGHTIYRVFFFYDGAITGNALSIFPQDERNTPSAWQALSIKHTIDMVVCVSSALKRGVIDETEAQRYGKSAASLAEGFMMSGLGQLVEASMVSDRIISFGG